MGQQVLKSSNEKMEKAVAAYSRELATVRAGRASSSVLDKVQVDYWCTNTSCAISEHYSSRSTFTCNSTL